MKTKWNIPLKVALAYALFFVLLAFAVHSLYGYVRFATRMQATEAHAAQRRNALGRLVRGLLDTENAERAVCLGDTSQWRPYEQALQRTLAAADSLKGLVPDSAGRLRLDSLGRLVEARRENTRRLLQAIGHSSLQAPLGQRAEQLRNGQDSIVLRPGVRRQVVETEQTYVVEKRKKKFFGRLADAFRRPGADTTLVRLQTNVTEGDSVAQRVDVGDSVAVILSEIGRQAGRTEAQKHRRIRRRSEELQATGMELTARAARLMQGIENEEQAALQQILQQGAADRQARMLRMGVLTILALLMALTSFLWIVRDVSRANRYRRQVERERERAEELLRQRERLLLTVTHDIKAPAASIAGFAELLAPQVQGREAQNGLQSIRNATAHLLKLVGTLLDYHRLEAGHVDVVPADFRPVRLMAEVAEGFRPLAQAKGLLLHLDTTAADPTATCRADAFRIRQIAENLLGNAIKYTTEGYVSLTVELAPRTLTFAVADTGPGLSEAEQERIFEAFARLARSQGTEGVGLGLSITRELVSLLGGTLSLDSRPGSGSIFSVTFPVEPPAGDTAPAAVPANPGDDGPADEVRPLRILLIDDNATQLLLTRTMLDKLSGGLWATTACSDVDELLKTLRREPFDLLLTDIEMPALNGFALLERIRALTGASGSLPVVALTAHGLLDTGHFQTAGFADCLFKPFTMEQLGRAVGHLGGSGFLPPPAAALSETEYHFDALTAFAAGDPQAERDILEQFLADLRQHAADLRTATEGHDAAAAGALAHKLLPTFTLIGAEIVPALQEQEARRNGTGWEAGDDERCRRVAAELEHVEQALLHRLPPSPLTQDPHDETPINS